MTRHPFPVRPFFLLSLICAATVACACQPPHPPDPLLRIPRGAAAGYNLLLITLDTTRADRLGCYGYAKALTPVLDGIAARGLRFTDAIATAPVTLPSHATIFTGLYPPNHGARSNSEYQLSPTPVTLAEWLHDAGYDTAAFVSAFVLDARFGLNQGFARYDGAVATATGPAFPSHTLERSAVKASRAVYMESIFPYLEYGWALLFAMRRLHDKYLLAPRPEYYDLRTDPHEMRNLFPTTTGPSQQAREELATALTAHLQ